MKTIFSEFLNVGNNLAVSFIENPFSRGIKSLSHIFFVILNMFKYYLKCFTPYSSGIKCCL